MELMNLGFNITKQCNLDCAHCLCGEPKNEFITKEVVDCALVGMEKVGEIYLTGGEPFLKPDLIYMTSEELKSKKVDVKGISITTNATIFNQDIKDALLYLFDGVADPRVFVSMDRFHKEAAYRYLKKIGINENDFSRIYEGFIKRLSDFCMENNINFATRDIGKIICMGRAKDLDSIKADNKIHALGNYHPRDHLYWDNITIDTTGHVLRCDYENDEVETLSIGNVLDKNLESIIYDKCVLELRKLGIKYTDPEVLKVAMNSKFMKKQFNWK